MFFYKFDNIIFSIHFCKVQTPNARFVLLIEKILFYYFTGYIYK